MTKLSQDFLTKLEEQYGPISQALSMCLRPTFQAEKENNVLVWGDWSAIEARVLPWLSNSSGGQEILETFRAADIDKNAPDIYMLEASKIHGVPAEDINDAILEGKVSKTAKAKENAKKAGSMRQEGKVAVLALGYGGGVNALQKMAANYGLFLSSDRAKYIVESWRYNNSWATQFWSDVQSAFDRARKNPESAHKAGLCTYIFYPSYHRGTMFCEMPCGRLLSYCYLKTRSLKKTDPASGVDKTEQVLSYRKRKSYGSIWHGILTENITQAVAASILRHTLKKIHYSEKTCEGMQVRGHTHDEIITECPHENRNTVSKILKNTMESSPSWAVDLPLAAEVASHWYYTKTKG